MRLMILRCLLPVLALSAFGLALPAAHAAETATTPALPRYMQSGLPMSASQKAVSFDLADLSFKIDPAQKRLQGDATLQFTARTPVTSLDVDLDPHFEILAVDVDGAPAAAGQWRNPNGRMTVTLPTPLAAGASARLRIRYAGSPHEAKNPPWDGGIVWAKAPTGEPWIATAVEGEGCDLFWPCIDHPMGEPARVDEHVTVPAPLVAPGNGRFVGMSETDGWRTWNWSARQPDTYAVALDIGPFEVLQADYHSRFGNTIPLRFWYLKGNEAKAKALFAQFPSMLDFFEQIVGPYPWGDEKMGVVETPHLGMEHQTINAYGNGYKLDVNGYDWLLHHELSHEWFGNQMTNVDWDDMWLHESFGMYMQPLYLLWLRGQMAYDAEMLRQRALIANEHPMVSGRSRPHGDPAAEAIDPGTDIYYKGAWMLHTLRNLIGDKAFFAATRQLVYGRDDPRPGNFAPRYAVAQDFIDAVRNATGRDYGWFFDVYLRSTALPKLEAVEQGGNLHLRWRTEGDKPFPLPVQVRVGDGLDGKLVDVPMTDGEGEIALSPGTHYTLDPDARVLRDAPEVDAYRADKAARDAQAAKSKAH